MFKQYPVSALSGSIVSILFVTVLWRQVPLSLLVSWLVIQNILLISGGYIAWRYFHTPKKSLPIHLWYRLYIAVISSIGLFWGCAAYFLAFDVPYFIQTFIIIFVAGVAATALVVSIPVINAYYTYLSLIILPMLVWMLVQSQDVLMWVGGLGVMFYFLLLFAGNNLNRQLVRTIRLRFKNAELVNKVEHLNENLEQRVAEKTSALSDSEERVDLAMQGANDGLWDCDMKNKTV